MHGGPTWRPAGGTEGGAPNPRPSHVTHAGLIGRVVWGGVEWGARRDRCTAHCASSGTRFEAPVADTLVLAAKTTDLQFRTTNRASFPSPTRVRPARKQLSPQTAARAVREHGLGSATTHSKMNNAGPLASWTPTSIGPYRVARVERRLANGHAPSTYSSPSRRVRQLTSEHETSRAFRGVG